MNLQQFGIIERPGYGFEYYSEPGYTMITTNIRGTNKDIYVVLEKPTDYKESLTELLRSK